MRKGKKIFTGIVLMVFVFLYACGQNQIQEDDMALTYLPELSAREEEFFLFRPFVYQLGFYNLELLQWNPIDSDVAQGAFFQGFGWGNIYPYFVFGQHERLFHAGKIAESTLNHSFTLENRKEALTPFATNGELFLYMIEQVTEDDYIKRVVTISNDGKLELIANLDGLPVMDGVIAGNYLYFTCPGENTDFFEIWRINLILNDPYQQPELIRNEYTTFRIYQYQGQVLFLDLERRILYNDEITIELSQRADLIMVDDEVSILVEMYVNSDMVLEIAFTDISSGEILGTFPGAINFIREGSIITIFGQGFIEHLDLQGE